MEHGTWNMHNRTLAVAHGFEHCGGCGYWRLYVRLLDVRLGVALRYNRVEVQVSMNRTLISNTALDLLYFDA